MPEQQFHFGSFLKLLAFALTFGIVLLFLNIQFGISFQTIQVAIVLISVILAIVRFLKIRALRPRPMTVHQCEIRELLAVQERQLDAMLEKEQNKIGPKP